MAVITVAIMSIILLIKLCSARLLILSPSMDICQLQHSGAISFQSYPMYVLLLHLYNLLIVPRLLSHMGRS